MLRLQWKLHFLILLDNNQVATENYIAKRRPPATNLFNFRHRIVTVTHHQSGINKICASCFIVAVLRMNWEIPPRGDIWLLHKKKFKKKKKTNPKSTIYGLHRAVSIRLSTFELLLLCKKRRKKWVRNDQA